MYKKQMEIHKITFIQKDPLYHKNMTDKPILNIEFHIVNNYLNPSNIFLKRYA